MSEIIINSLGEFVEEIIKLNNNIIKAMPIKNEVLLYRGHSDNKYKIEPAISRGRECSTSISLFNHERNMYEMAQYKRPDIFRADLRPLEMMALLQHYGIPTRLLDVSENPLVALYFACNSRTKKDKYGKSYTPDGEVIVFAHNELSAATYPIINAIADTYHIVGDSNVDVQMSDFLKKASKQSYFYEQITFIEGLLSPAEEVSDDVPEWMKNADQWIKSNCNKPLFVYAPVRLQRQQAQSGRYILFPNKIVPSIYDETQLAFTSEIEPIKKDSSCIKEILIIPKDKKDTIIRELNMFCINKETLFPDNIDIMCESIKYRFSQLV